jgi:hypothetical protein
MPQTIRLCSLGFLVIVTLGIATMSPAPARAGCFLAPDKDGNYDRFVNIKMCGGLLGQLLGEWTEVKCGEEVSPKARERNASVTLGALFTEPRVTEFRYLPF